MKVKKAFVIFLVIFLLAFAVVFELGKNTLWGWAILIALFVGYFFAHAYFLSEKHWAARLAAWVCFIILGLAVMKISGPPVKIIPAVDTKNPQATEVVEIEQGKLTGVYTEDKKVEVYTGIPYAKPPVGELRWKEPQAPDGWEGVKKCDYFAPMSMQQQGSVIFNTLTDIVAFHNFKISLKDNYIEPRSEDSLYLNIWKPSGNIENAPVLFFIHGGSLTGGRTWNSEYNGEELAKKGIVVVNFAYRLNVFGYYANSELSEESPNKTTGNYGLLDQIQALKWVNENIEAFGGDPSQITIAGESAGSSSVNAICVSPLSKGLFKRAIAESSGITAKVPYHTFRNMKDALKMGNDIMDEFGAKSISDLRKIDAEKLVDTSFTNSAMTVDGYAIKEQPYLTYEKGENNEEALLNGFNVHEADLFTFTIKVTDENYSEVLSDVLGEYADEAISLYPSEPVNPDYKLAIVETGGNAKGSFNKVMSAAWFTYSHHNWSRLMAEQNRPVYEYYFTKDNKSLGSNHAGEMPYAYGNLKRHAWLYDESDYELSDIMMDYWVNFVKTGNPNGEGLPEWKLFNEDNTKVLELGKDISMVEDPNLELYEIIDKYQNNIAE